MKRPIIISFYTPNYREFADNLKRSVKKFEFDFTIPGIQPIGKHWINNVYWRANFIQTMLNKYQHDLVWIDADAEMKAYPFLFDNFEGDFGAHFYQWPKSERCPNGVMEVLGGTMYFAYNDRVMDLVNEWVKLNTEKPLQPRSQWVLQMALKNWSGNIVNFPPSYCYINRFMSGKCNPVIEHYQASGKFRKADEEGFSDVSMPPKGDL
jgi:hypothetical protein